MQNYFSRVLLLKPIEKSLNKKCLLRLEFIENSTRYHGELYGFENTTNLKVIISLNGKTLLERIDSLSAFSGETNNISSFINASAVILENEVPVCYGESGNDCLTLDELISHSSPYDDELIASENYYEGGDYEPQRIYNTAVNSNEQLKKEEASQAENSQPLLYESEPCNSQETTFFEGIKDKVESLISSFSKNEELEKIIPDSSFCKISYDGDKFYSVGVINEGGSPKYICYAVNGDFASISSDIKPYFKFVPLSPFAPYGAGYYLIFQSAKTGETLTFTT